MVFVDPACECHVNTAPGLCSQPSFSDSKIATDRQTAFGGNFFLIARAGRNVNNAMGKILGPAPEERDPKENTMSGGNVILFRWEKWRIAYNLILLVEGLWVLREHLVDAVTHFWGFMVLFAIAANACYSLGPLLEIGVRRLLSTHAEGTRNRSILAGFRCFLFWAGLVFSMWLVWMLSLTGLIGYLGGSIHYVYKTEFRDQTLAFVSFLAWGFASYLALMFLFRFIVRVRGKKA